MLGFVCLFFSMVNTFSCYVHSYIIGWHSNSLRNNVSNYLSTKYQLRGTEVIQILMIVGMLFQCLWKLVRLIPDRINELNLDRIIADIHNFLKAFPNHTWKTRANDTPLRTVKTILHSLVTCKGPQV